MYVHIDLYTHTHTNLYIDIYIIYTYIDIYMSYLCVCVYMCIFTDIWTILLPDAEYVLECVSVQNQAGRGTTLAN